MYNFEWIRFSDLLDLWGRKVRGRMKNDRYEL